MHRRLISLARRSRVPFALTVLAGVLGGWLIIAQAYLVSAVISRVFVDHQALAQVSRFMGLLLAVILGRGILVWVSESAAGRIAQRVTMDLRGRLIRHILALGPAFSRDERTGELTATAVDGIDALDAYFGQYLPQLIVCILVPLSILLIVLPRDLLSGVILLVTAPLIPFFMYMIGQDAQVAAGKRYRALGRLSSYFLDSLQGLTTLKIFGQSKAQAANLARVSDEFRRLTLKVMQTSFLSAFALELLATVSTAIIAVEVGLRLLYGRMPFEAALFILVLAPEFYWPLRLLGQRFHASLAGTTAARRIFRVLDTPLPVTGSQATGSPVASPPGSSNDWAINLDGVSYTYPGRSEPAVQGISLHIPAGQHLALVGATGAGKSTLAALLLGFMEPTHGQISFMPPASDPSTRVRRSALLAWVPQRPYLFNDTIAANIRLGCREAPLEAVMRAARLAQLDAVVQALPDKYATFIGEGGARLSSGEAQRLALARAFLRNAPILILDEPTSSLDPENEALLEESTRELMAGRTVVTIAHRLNTVFQADRIIVLRDGRLVEAGTHAELLALGAEYSRLVDAAAGAWRMPGASAPPAPTLSDAPAGSIASTSGQGVPSAQRRRSEVISVETSKAWRNTFGRLLPFLRNSWGLVLLSVLLGGLTIGSSIALMGTSAWLISLAALHPSIAALSLAIVGVRFFGIARAVFRYLERLTTHSVTLHVLRNLRVWFYERLEPLAPARLMQYAAGDLLGRVILDVDTLENFYVRILAPPLVACLVLVATCAYLIAQGSVTALPLAVFALLIGALLPVIVRRAGRSPASSLIRSRAEIQSRVVDTLEGLADIVAFGAQRDCLDAIHQAGAAQAAAESRLSRINALQTALTTSLTGSAMWSLLILAIPLVRGGRLDGLMLAPLALITLSAFEAIAPLPVAAQWWNPVRSAAGRLFDLISVSPPVPEGDAPSLPRVFAEKRAGQRGQPAHGLRVKDLSFTYPGASVPALQHVDFEVGPGSSLVIVGPSGAGKSTIASLLMRFWEYPSGEILLDGLSLRDRPAERVRELIGLVSPNAHFFDTSIYENLRMAGRQVSRQQVEQAARAACIHDFIASLPGGYDTIVGEHGMHLSAGERQRLAIARVIIKDAPFLILDEPAANLDPGTGNLVLQTLFHLMQQKCALLITHQLLGLENLGAIVVLDRGTVVERGTHAALLAQGGLYRRLWDLQNRIWERP